MKVSNINQSVSGTFEWVVINQSEVDRVWELESLGISHGQEDNSDDRHNSLTVGCAYMTAAACICMFL